MKRIGLLICAFVLGCGAPDAPLPAPTETTTPTSNPTPFEEYTFVCDTQNATVQNVGRPAYGDGIATWRTRVIWDKEYTLPDRFDLLNLRLTAKDGATILDEVSVNAETNANRLYLLSVDVVSPTDTVTLRVQCPGDGRVTIDANYYVNNEGV